MLNAVILYSVGSPQNLTTACLKDFLNRFLSDKLVVKMPRFLWQPILHSLILPTRPERLKERYGAIFDHESNPYLALCERLATALQANLNKPSTNSGSADQYVVKMSYAYCAPYLEPTLYELAAQGCQRITVIALFPQYSDTTSKRPRLILERFAQERPDLECHLVSSYASNPIYLDALSDLTRSFLYGTGAQMSEAEPQPTNQSPASTSASAPPVASAVAAPERTHLLLTFHSLPKSYIRLGDPYLSEVEATVQGLKARLNLSEASFSLAYNGRFGPMAWLKPDLEDEVTRLLEQGVQHLMVVAPGFAVDCLETLYDINLKLKERFIHQGGERFTYIPCLNDTQLHVNILTELCLKAPKLPAH